jgi:hypothetical protein
MDKLDNGDMPVDEAELRGAADELRRQADEAPTVEMRIVILDAAEHFERLARERLIP